MKKPNNDKTIEVCVRLWTNGLPTDANMPLAWPKGMAYVIKNDSKAVKNTKSIPFNDLCEMPDAILKALALAGVHIVVKP